MAKTIALVTSQYRCDRIICTARQAADETGTELAVIGIMDSEYELNPQAIEYLFDLSKQNKAVMNLVFTEDKEAAIGNVIGQRECKGIVTGMPNGEQSVVYKLWKRFPGKDFYTVDMDGNLLKVETSKFCSA